MAAPLGIFLWGFVGSVIAPVLIRAITFLGIGFTAYKGIDVLLDGAMSEIQAAIGSGPTQMVQLLGLAQVDVAITMIFSAVATRFLIAGVTGGVFKRIGFK